MIDKEPKHALILRLLAEVQSPRKADVSIVDALEFRRDQYGLKRTEFAAVLGMTPGHYSEVISGKRSLPINATKRAYAIGVPADVLLQISALQADGHA